MRIDDGDEPSDVGAIAVGPSAELLVAGAKIVELELDEPERAPTSISGPFAIALLNTLAHPELVKYRFDLLGDKRFLDANRFSGPQTARSSMTRGATA